MQERSKIMFNSLISYSLDDTLKFAYDLARNSKQGDIYCLEGDLGVGKTIIAKGIGKFFNIKENITSPTFTILKSYNVDKHDIKKINHFDLYRIKNVDELLNIGFEEYICEKNSITIIEWPEIAYKLLPETVTKIAISKINNNDSYRAINIIK